MSCKRMLCLLTVSALLLSGCRKDVGNDISDISMNFQDAAAAPLTEPETVPETEDEPLTNVVDSETLYMPVMYTGITSLMKTADGYMSCCDINHLYQYDAELNLTGTLELVQPAPYDGYYPSESFISVTDTTIYALYSMANYYGMSPEAYVDDMEIDGNPYGDIFTDWEIDYYLCTYAFDGTLRDKIKLSNMEDILDAYGHDISFCKLYSNDTDVFAMLCDGGVMRIASDGMCTVTYGLGEGESSEDIYPEIILDRDGKPVYYTRTYVQTSNIGKYRLDLREFDTGTGIPGEMIYSDLYEISYPEVFSGGFGEYRLVFTDDSGHAIGIRDDGTEEILIDWQASDLDSMPVVALPDGSFIGQYQDYFSEECTIALMRLHRLKPSEQHEKLRLRVGMLHGSDIFEDTVRKFNRAHDDIHVDITIYDQGADDLQAWHDTMNADIHGEDPPDLIMLYGGHEDFLCMGSNGLLLDLNGLLDADTEMNRDMLVGNVLTALEHSGGSLYSMPNGFAVNTMAVKSKYNVPENWTMDDLLALYNDAGEMQYYWDTKEEMLDMLLTGTSFVDVGEEACSFDSPEFYKMLEFCDRYPQESTKPEGGYYEDAKVQKWNDDCDKRYVNDEDYLLPVSLITMDGFTVSPYSYVIAELGEDVTLTGYPSDNGQGGKIYTDAEIAITASCQNKEAAWEFVRMFVLTTGNMTPSLFPLTNEGFEAELDDQMYIYDFFEDAYGNYTLQRTDYSESLDEAGLHGLTQEERDMLETYIRSCREYCDLSVNVETIIKEETGKYFAGTSTAEDTAAAARERILTYLHELWS